MKLKLLVLLSIACMPLCSIAQSALTIFSEDGDKFFLVLNGQKQNTVPQTNIRIDGLAQPFYNAKIVFEDKTKPEISKNLQVVDPASSAPADVTYKIKKTKDGDLKVRYFSAIPVEPNYVAPPDMYVMHFGQPAPAATTVTQTTMMTTTTPPPAGINVNTGAGGVSMSVNMGDPNMGNGGMNMNINVNDPGTRGASQTQTTTTTTTSYSSTSANSAPPSQPAHTGCQYPMDANGFRAARESVSKASFEDTKLSTAKTILSSNCFSADQVITICNLFSFEESKLNFAKFAYSKCTDAGNYFKVGNIFNFDASREELNNYISGH
jgi:hypothetical protein